MTNPNREQWLTSAVDKLRPLFKHHKLDIPENVVVSCGWPSKGGAGQNNPVMGEAWDASATLNLVPQIFISPRVSEPIKVLEILVHESLHQALPSGEKHGPRFKNAMKDLGLEGKATATAAGADLLARLEPIAAELGDYPNSAIHVEMKPAAKSGQKSTFKCFCAHKRDCDKKCQLLDKNVGKDYAVSVGKKNLDLGMPICPCGEKMELEPDDFRAWQEQKVAAGEGNVSDKDI
jgi:hypothetical protein